MKIKQERKTISKINSRLIQKELAEICRRHGVRSLRVFGSVVRKEETEKSDIDMIVDFTQPIGFVELIQLENELARILGRKVDLVTEKAISPYLRHSILTSSLKVFEDA
jgi:predicted nucleotidyltransferase